MPDRQSDKTCAAEVFLERPLPNKDSLRIFNIRVVHTRVDPRADTTTNESTVQMQFVGSLAVIMSELMFSKGDPAWALIKTGALFATGFLVRPFGALV